VFAKLPQALFLLVAAVAVLLHFLVVPLTTPEWLWLRFLGAALAAIGVNFMLGALMAMSQRRTSAMPWKEPEALVTHGVFRFSRNPIYLAFSLFQLGIALWLEAPTPEREAAIEGSGPGGLITRRDVRSAIEAAGANTAPAPSAPIAAPASAAPAAELAPVEPGAIDTRTGLTESRRVPMGTFRKAVSASLSRSRTEIPEATVWVDVDATELVRLRQSDPEGPGLLAYVARFVLAGLRAYPELNGLVDTEREELVQYDGVNLGLAVQTDRGLVAPAVMGAHKLTTAELDTEIKGLTRLAREGKATPAQLTGGTFTLNNFGSLRVDGSAAIINHPQVAILGIGRIIDRPWVVDGELTVRKITQLSFAFDHRVCDGGAAAGFMRVVADAMENPAGAIAHL
jgi:pyruvate dehydrogenase E2 component (dihydrolipoamide acetyltransferase)